MNLTLSMHTNVIKLTEGAKIMPVRHRLLSQLILHAVPNEFKFTLQICTSGEEVPLHLQRSLASGDMKAGKMHIQPA